MPGHRSETPTTTVERLGIKPGLRVWVGGHQSQAKAEIEPHLAGTIRPPEGPLDLAFVTPQSVDEAVYFAGKLLRRLQSNGTLWVIHPNNRSPHAAQFRGQIDDLVVSLFERGFTQAGTMPVGHDFSALAFRQENPETEAS